MSSGDAVGDPCECGSGPKVRTGYGCANCETLPRGAGREQDVRVRSRPAYRYAGPLTRGEVRAVLNMNVFGAGRD